MPVETLEMDVVVFGGTSSGVAAAIAARRTAQRLRIEPRIGLVWGEPRALGGMLTNGICSVDVLRLAAAPNGLFREFADRIAGFYDTTPPVSDGVDSERLLDGLVYEPAVAFDALRGMLDETERIYQFPDMSLLGVTLEGTRVTAVDLAPRTGEPLRLTGTVFIDASVEGDLLGLAGAEHVDWVWGREARSELVGREDVHPLTAAVGETFAGRVIVDPRTSSVLGGDGAGDRRSQSFNYRLTLAKNGWVPPEWSTAPPDRYLEHLEYYRTHTRPPLARGRPCPHLDIPGGHWVQQCLPNDKADLNIDPINLNHGYVTGSRLEREEIARAILDFCLGYVYFLREERGLEVGLSTDDYSGEVPIPSALYVREGRRLLGEYVFSEWDARATAPSVRPQPPPRSDFVASGEYSMDSHCVSGFANELIEREGIRLCEGGFWLPMTKPYQVPYAVLVPQRIDGLLVSTAVSSSHVGYSTLRMEPVRMALGQAAGTAAAHALRARVEVRDVRVDRVQFDLAVARQSLMFWDNLPAHSGQHPSGRRSSWALPYLQFLGGRGALAHFGSGFSIDPNEQLTRGRLADLIVAATSRDVTAANTPFYRDVDEENLHFRAIQVMHERGWLRWWGEEFSPERVVSRAELAKVMKFVADIPFVPRTEPSSFVDVAPQYWAFPYIESLVRNRLIYASGEAPRYRPFDVATLAEAAQILTLSIVRSQTPTTP